MKGSEKINIILEDTRKKAAQFAKEIGLSSPQNIYDIQKDQADISKDVALCIIEKYPRYNLKWLLYGKGEKLKTESDNYRLVPLKNYDFVGGLKGNSDATPTDAEYTIGMIPFNGAHENDICVPVTGDSMMPTCPSGSIVLIREVAEWEKFFGYGDIFCILLKDGRRLLKEINESKINSKDYVLCVSHNSDVKPEELPINMIHRVWKVIKVLIDKGW